MSMRPLLLTLLLGFLFPTDAVAADLYRRDINQVNPGGKDLVMSFEEVRRDAKTSLVKVTYKSGASVASSMFIVRGCYEIARARGALYFIKLKEWEAEGGSRMYLVGFSTTKSISPTEYFGLTEPLPITTEHDFMSVQDFGRLFEPQR